MDEPLFGCAHFPDNYLRGFFIDPYTSRLMMTKASTPYGNFSSLTWSTPTLAFERARVTECRLHYMPQEFLFCLCLIRDVPTLLYYSVEIEQFVDVVEVLGKILNFRSESLRSAVKLAWDDPLASHLYDKVAIRRKEGNYPSDIDDGTLIYQGNGNEIKDGNLLMATEYFYRAFPNDLNGEVNDDEEGQTLSDSPLDLVTSLFLVHSNYVILEGLSITEDSNEANVGVYAQSSMSRISNSQTSNKQTAIEGIYGSYIASQNNTGANNEIGLRASENARIAKVGTQPDAQTPELTEEGGIII